MRNVRNSLRNEPFLYRFWSDGEGPTVGYGVNRRVLLVWASAILAQVVAVSALPLLGYGWAVLPVVGVSMTLFFWSLLIPGAVGYFEVNRRGKAAGFISDIPPGVAGSSRGMGRKKSLARTNRQTSER